MGDFHHFERLLDELGHGPTCGDTTDCWVKVQIPLASWTKNSTKVEVEVRYQQFSEFSTYTFALEEQEGSPLETCGRFGTLTDLGERLVESLKRLGSWWQDF